MDCSNTRRAVDASRLGPHWCTRARRVLALTLWRTRFYHVLPRMPVSGAQHKNVISHFEH